MSPYSSIKSRILTNLTVYPLVMVVFVFVDRMMNNYKVDILSIKGLVIYFAFMIALALIYIVITERFFYKEKL